MDDAFEVLANRHSPVPPDEAYWRFLLRRAQDHSWRRRQKLLSFRSAEDWERHGALTRERFRAALGPMPERTPLNPQVVGVLERGDYIVEKLLIESQPDFFIAANLYRPPAISSPLPAILNPVGHWAASKAEEVVQARGIGLARKGFVALTYDPIGQGERSQFRDGRPDHPPSSTTQHSAVHNPCVLIGQTVINYMVWDGLRLLDYLETRPDVDTSRIGCTGASGGGTYTMFLTAYDARIKAAIPVCSTSTYERMLAQAQIGEPCQDPIASYPNDLDMADLLMAAAPAAIQIIAATYDSFPLSGTREVFLDLQNCYAARGIAERAALVEIPSHHDYNRPMREAMYAWFSRWLGGDAEPTEDPYVVENPATLSCTPTGQVLTSLGGQTVQSLNRSRARDLEGTRPKSPEAADEAKLQRQRTVASVSEVLQLRKPVRASQLELVGREIRDGTIVEQVVFESEVDLPIPGLVFALSERPAGPAVLFLHDRDKGIEARTDGLILALVRAGVLVYAVDLRGWGETAWRRRQNFDADDFALLGNDSLLAYVGYLLGNWPLAQRISDALGAFDILSQRPDVDSARVGIIGRGIGGLVALHATALEPRAIGVGIYETIGSYQSAIESDRYTLPASAFLPGLLLRYDLPDLVGALAPRSVFLGNPLDALGQVLTATSAERTFGVAQVMNRLLGAPSRLSIRTNLSREGLVEALVAWATRLGDA